MSVGRQAVNDQTEGQTPVGQTHQTGACRGALRKEEEVPRTGGEGRRGAEMIDG